MIISSVTPGVLTLDGGYLIAITGTGFPLNTPLYAYIGAAGAVTDAPCYSGVAGQGNILYARNATTVLCYSPRLAAALAHYTLLLNCPSPAAAASLVDAFAVRPPFFYSEVFALRSILPPNYATGPRSLDREPPL